MATAYTVLGVEATASHDEIASAFRTKSVECHPDKATDDADRAERTARMSRLTLAWRYLGDPDARAKYDRRLADTKPTPEAAQPPDNESLDSFLGRLRSTSRGEAGQMVEEFGRAAGLQGPELDRARHAAQKTAEIAGNVADLIGLFRGYQR